MIHNRYIDVLYKQPNKKPKKVRIENNLEDMRKLVGGDIKILNYSDVLLVCNNKGKIKGLEPNVLLKNNMIYGSFFIVGDDKEKADFISLTEKQFTKFKNELLRGNLNNKEMEDDLEWI